MLGEDLWSWSFYYTVNQCMISNSSFFCFLSQIAMLVVQFWLPGGTTSESIPQTSVISFWNLRSWGRWSIVVLNILLKVSLAFSHIFYYYKCDTRSYFTSPGWKLPCSSMAGMNWLDWIEFLHEGQCPCHNILGVQIHFYSIIRQLNCVVTFGHGSRSYSRRIRP